MKLLYTLIAPLVLTAWFIFVRLTYAWDFFSPMVNTVLLGKSADEQTKGEL
jgi:hypothetical protein